ncbi:MAG: restriction endonuclease [Lachnospiraceae bacterium]|nr:restriction endonuclease [Lachnospiraceae bacterium]
MIPYDTAKINQMINESQSSSTTYDNGRKFEDLACYLFETIPGITIAKRNAMNQYDTEEVDVSIWNDKHQDGLPFINNIFLVECKNWSSSVGSVDVNWFATKVEDRGLDFGVLLATNGITKETDEIKRAQSILSGYLRKHIRIIVIDKEEILSLVNTYDMINLIKNKICELVVNG